MRVLRAWRMRRLRCSRLQGERDLLRGQRATPRASLARGQPAREQQMLRVPAGLLVRRVPHGLPLRVVRQYGAYLHLLHHTPLLVVCALLTSLLTARSSHSATQDVAPSYRTIATLGCCSRSSYHRRRCLSRARRCPWKPSSACTCGRRRRSGTSAAVSVPQTVAPANTASRHVHVPRNSQRASLV